MKNILKEINIKNADSILKAFIDEKNFLAKYNELITNLKCKCFYQFFWFDFLMRKIKNFYANSQFPLINIKIK